MLFKKIKHYIAIRLNGMIMRTNWWNNMFVHTHQFVSNLGYRDNLVRNLQIANVGSNPARFCFFYEDILGQNWSTGTQGLNMDLEVLRFNHSYLSCNAVVLLPLVPFSLVSEYLKNKIGFRDYKYYVKYINALDPSQINALPCAKDIWGFAHSPIQYNHKAWKYLISDEEPDRRLEITDQQMMLADLMNDADMFMSGWKHEFDIKDLSDTLPEHLTKGMDDSVALLAEMIDFLSEREYRPVIVLPPMTSVLYDKFPQVFWQTYIYDGITKLNRPNIPVLDYLHDKQWQSSDLYFNSLFMNLKGRKLFTRQVINDIEKIAL